MFYRNKLFLFMVCSMWVCPCINNGVFPRFSVDCVCEYDNSFACFGFKIMLHLNVINCFSWA
jgi:hypothetical protein